MPGTAGGPFRTKTCLYTLTPDRDFVLDACPSHPASSSRSGAAHAYKFARVFGTDLAELALDGVTPSAPELVASGSTGPSSRGRPRRRSAGQNRRLSRSAHRDRIALRARAACEPSPRAGGAGEPRPLEGTRAAVRT